MMELVPVWLVVLASITVSVIVLMLLLSLLKKKNRAIFKLGTRYSNSNRAESMAKALPVALLTAIILSSLSVGDGLFEMVGSNTEKNLSEVDVVIEAPGFIHEDLIPQNPGYEHASVIFLEGSGRSDSGRGNSLKLMGIDETVFKMGGFTGTGGQEIEKIVSGNDVIINRKAAGSMGLTEGDWLVVTVILHDRSDYIFLSSTEDGKISLNLTVRTVVKNKGLGRYREDALDEVEPLVFMSLDRLQERLDRNSQANRFLVDLLGDHSREELSASIEEELDLATAGFREVEPTELNGTFIISDEFFFDDRIVEKTKKGSSSLSYFVDSISTNNRGLTYSVVTGFEKEKNGPGIGEIYLNNWTSENLGAGPGDEVELAYRFLNGYGILESRQRTFTVSRVVPIEGIYAERNYLPPIEGVTSEISCSDWDPDFEVNISAIPQIEYDYWEIFSTTPKAFISLEDAREMWANSWGNSTALFYSGENDDELLERDANIENVDMTIIPVRENALSSSRAISIFPAMFLTFGMTIVVSTSLVLYAVLTDLTKRRSRDWGILRAVGIERRNMAAFGIYENIRPILMGGLVGIFLGFFLSMILGEALDSIWSETVEGSDVPFSFSFSSVMISFAVSMVLSLMIVVISVVKEVARTPTANVREESSLARGTGAALFLVPFLGAASIAGGSVVSLLMRASGSTFETAGPFVLTSVLFSTGATMVVLFLVSRKWGISDVLLYSTASISRRPGRTLVGSVLLAMVLTLSLTLTSFGGILEADITESSDSYGGGFDLIMETSTGIEGAGIDPDSLEGFSMVPVLSYGKEGGTCSNINAVYPPRLLGLPDRILEDPSFTLKAVDDSVADGSDNRFDKLESRIGGNIPIFVDENTLTWIYFGSIGTIFELEPNPGTLVKLQVVGILDPSVLTGTFVMKEKFLKEIYPSSTNYDLFLINGDTDDESITRLKDHFADLGPQVDIIEERAREELRYELSYLGLFRDYLLLGVVVALIAVAIFNHSRALRFRKEISILRSIGVDRKRAFRYIFTENSISLFIAYSGSILGALITLMLSVNFIADDVKLWNIISGPLVLMLFLLVLGMISTLASSYWATKDHDRMLPSTDT